MTLEFHVKGALYQHDRDGINILVLNNDGSINTPVTGFTSADQLSYYISSLSPGKIVLMGVHIKGIAQDNHMPDSQTFTQSIAALKSIGSSLTAYNQIEGKPGWALIGCKDEQKPWIAESLTDTPLTAAIPHLK
ncbi:uncharacterized protein LOC110240334 [Exaiptasia diaphana]|uniref:ILEI/PANDER domain-containing protein n=1 Tax=Exaiptasia diaphana TaxID=2652724 RepID=A0A913XB73_EXADI|nr:uncharacterized protein LOC110240334 [Exaiptasia diaphana]